MDVKLLLIIILFIGMDFFLCMSIFRRNKCNKIKKELEELKDVQVPYVTITTERPEQVKLVKEYRMPEREFGSSEMSDEIVNMIQKRMLNEMVDQIYPYVNYIYNYEPMRQEHVIRAQLRVLK